MLISSEDNESFIDPQMCDLLAESESCTFSLLFGFFEILKDVQNFDSQFQCFSAFESMRIATITQCLSIFGIVS
jgi:hypothetical protein